MEIEIFTLCDYAVDNNGKLTVVGTFDTITSKNYPAKHPSMAIAARLRFGKEEFNDHEFQIKFTKKDDEDWFKPLSGKMTVGKNLDQEYATTNLVVNIQHITFKEPGKYSIELLINGEWKSGLHLKLQSELR